MAYCHKAVRAIAKEMAGTAYETLAKQDWFYKQHPNQNLFIAKNWGRFLPFARKSLLDILASNAPEEVKADTYEIVIKDRVLQDVRSVSIPQGSA